MAKLRAHGEIVGTVEYLATAKRVMSDGIILRYVVDGWKLHAKCRIPPEQVYSNMVDRLESKLAARPELKEYRRLLHETAPLSKRWKLHAAVQLMPDDADGVWSEACDGYGDNVHADVDEIGALCRAYLAATAGMSEAAE